ncbi:MAG: TraB/GumN family protein [Pseudomonadota bacterium]
MLTPKPFKILLASYIFFFAAQAHAHPFLYQASGDTTFYLFGTIHVPDPRIATLPNEVVQAMEESTAFYGELDLGEDNLMQIKESMMIPGNKTIYDLISIDTQNKVNNYLASINPDLNLDYFANRKIWVLAVTISLLEQQLRYPQLSPIDVALFNKAVELNKKAGGLETIEEQAGPFDALSNDEQIQLLEDTIDYLTEQDDDFIGSSVQDYIDGDLDGLVDELTSYMQGEVFYDDLLFQIVDQRNVHMADRIANMVSQNPDDKYFFAVGVGHLWGDASIISLLEERGYSFELVE